MEISQNKLMIEQKAMLTEVFTKFELSNKYKILDEIGNELYYAYEESGFISRQILGTRRPLTLKIVDKSNKILLTMNKPFYWLYADFTIKSPKGEILGYIKQKKWFLTKQFDVYDRSKQLCLKSISKIPKIWTFDVFRGPNKVGSIIKKWSGILKEFFTDADHYDVDFGSISDKRLKELILALVFAIDLRKFEKKKR